MCIWYNVGIESLRPQTRYWLDRIMVLASSVTGRLSGVVRAGGKSIAEASAADRILRVASVHSMLQWVYVILVSLLATDLEWSLFTVTSDSCIQWSGIDDYDSEDENDVQ